MDNVFGSHNYKTVKVQKQPESTSLFLPFTILIALWALAWKQREDRLKFSQLS
jgi:hypothetical protein